MINYLGKEQEKKLANALYYGGGYTKKYSGGGMAAVGEFLKKGTKFKSEQQGDTVTAGLGVASAAVSALDNDPEYGNADVAGSALQFASMGATAGPIGAAIGGAVGLGVGLITKNKRKKEKRRLEKLKKEKDSLATGLAAQARRGEGYQDGGKIQEAEPIQPSNAGSIDYSAKFGYSSGLIGPNDNPRFYTKYPKDENILDKLMPSPETAYRLASRFIEPASMPDLSIQQDNTSLPKAPITYRANTEDDFYEDMQKYGHKFSSIGRMSTGNYNTGGMTKGAYSHKTNPLAVVDKNGNHTGMELTGGEGVFDKPAMEKIKRMVAGGQFKEAGVFVNNEMKTWKHK